MRTHLLAPLLALCLLGGSLTVASRAEAQASASMTCAQAQAGSSSPCGTLTVDSGSIYPERVVGVSVAPSSFVIGANTCQAGLELVNNPCSMSVSYNAAASDSGQVPGLVTVTYQICYIDGDNHEICGGNTSKSIPISVFVTPTPTPTPPAPVTVPATATPSSGGTDVSYLPNCYVNVSTQHFCVVVPI